MLASVYGADGQVEAKLEGDTDCDWAVKLAPGSSPACTMLDFEGSTRLSCSSDEGEEEGEEEEEKRGGTMWALSPSLARLPISFSARGDGATCGERKRLPITLFSRREHWRQSCGSDRGGKGGGDEEDAASWSSDARGEDDDSESLPTITPLATPVVKLVWERRVTGGRDGEGLHAQNMETPSASSSGGGGGSGVGGKGDGKEVGKGWGRGIECSPGVPLR